MDPIPTRCALIFSENMSRGLLLVRTQPQGGRPPPRPLQTPKWLYGTMGFVGLLGFCFRHTAGGNFFV